MKISELQINEFRCLKKIKIKLGSYITVIAGHNMTGKSTILALIAHSSATKKPKPLIKNQFGSDWNEIITTNIEEQSYPVGFAKISFIEDINETNPTQSIEYGVTKQKAESRYRLLVRKRNEQVNRTAKKIEWPILYLGLSRLYPMGESETKEIIKNKIFINYIDEIITAYNKILNIEKEDIKSFDNYNLDIKNKKATGIETSTYKSWANSAGQDNLGQIILGILSFKMLKEQQGAQWNGGMLLIDEIDATMHPYALNQLIGYMFKQAKEIGIQIIFTTHSMTLLEYIATKIAYNKKNEESNNYELNYLTTANRIIKNYTDYDIDSIHCDLYRTTSNSLQPVQVPIYSEDDEARWFLEKILNEDYKNNINIVKTKLGCENLLQLLSNDYKHFTNHIFLFDGDVKDETIEKYTKIAGIKEFKNIIKLPCEASPEEVLYDYLKNLSPDHYIFEGELAARQGYSYDCLIKTNGPESYGSLLIKREQNKQWFNNNKVFMDELICHWKEDYINIVDEFNKQFKIIYNNIAKGSIRIKQL